MVESKGGTILQEFEVPIPRQTDQRVWPSPNKGADLLVGYSNGTPVIAVSDERGFVYIGMSDLSNPGTWSFSSLSVPVDVTGESRSAKGLAKVDPTLGTIGIVAGATLAIVNQQGVLINSITVSYGGETVYLRDAVNDGKGNVVIGFNYGGYFGDSSALIYWNPQTGVKSTEPLPIAGNIVGLSAPQGDGATVGPIGVLDTKSLEEERFSEESKLANDRAVCHNVGDNDLVLSDRECSGSNTSKCDGVFRDASGELTGNEMRLRPGEKGTVEFQYIPKRPDSDVMASYSIMTNNPENPDITGSFTRGVYGVSPQLDW